MKIHSSPSKPYDLEVGVDVAKLKLDIFYTDQFKKIPNKKSAIMEWLRPLKKRCPSLRVSCESTGTYANTLIKACLQLKVPISLLNPTMVKNFIRSEGRFAKTDRIDAKAIAAYASYHKPKCLEEEWLERDVLKQYHRRIEALKQARANNKASLDKYDSADVRADIASDIKSQTRRIERLEAKIDAYIENHSELQQKRQILEAVKGVGRATSNALLLHMPELGSINRRQVSALAGLAPQHNDSGTFQGRRMIKGGRGSVRRCLYMAAVVTATNNEKFKGSYQRLKLRGKPGKVAIIATARKLLIYLNTLLKNEPVKI